MHQGPPHGYGAPPPQQGYPPQPTVIVNNNGCLKAILVGLAIVVLAPIATCATCAVMADASRSSQPKPDAAALAAALAEASDAEAQSAKKVEAQREAVRKGCKMTELQPVFLLDDESLVDKCQAMVKESATVPSSVDFPTVRDVKLTSDDGCRRIFRSHLDGKNAFGVKVRTRFECSLDPRTGDIKTKALP